jgi:hypothetical protein
MEKNGFKSAKEYWFEKFDEYPQTDSERLAVAMMATYGEYVKESIIHTPPPPSPTESKD